MSVLQRHKLADARAVKPFVVKSFQLIEDAKLHVTEAGEIWKRTNRSHPERPQWKKRKLETDKDGYKRIGIAGKHHLVHRLVYRAFVGPLVDGLVVCHLDGDRTNNAPLNLLQTDQKTNIGHKKEHGTWQSGEAHGRASITNETAAFIKSELDQSERYPSGRLKRGEAKRIAALSGASIFVVYDINNKKAWS